MTTSNWPPDSPMAGSRATRANCGVGAIMDLDGGRSHDSLSDALGLLENLEHRGTTGADRDTGDGAGVMLQIPHEFFVAELGPLPDQYGIGVFFLPQDPARRESITDAITETLGTRDLTVHAWRKVPTDNSTLGETALENEPVVVQSVIGPEAARDPAAFDRELFVARNALETAIDGDRFHVVSLDRQTIVYKGLLKSTQLREYYPDLQDQRVRTNFALVHARFSTNTLGAWHLAHPYRNIVHNGEFNTIQGNINWMRARESELASPHFDEAAMDTVTPVISNPDQSDTASIDNALDLLLHSGRDLPHALRMLIPEAWRGDDSMAEARRDWYDYHASLVEPWDGPALVLGTDGDRIAGVLDRNGLRPFRYEITDSGRLVMASEQGAVQHDPATVRERGRLKPGQLFVADPEAGRVIPDDEVFDDLTKPAYGEWVDAHQERLSAPNEPTPTTRDPAERRSLQATFGYTRDELDEMLKPMLEGKRDPVGSMGDDTPLAGLSAYTKPLFDYFRQRFAQVTNPPIDYIREELVTSLETRIGQQRNLLEETPEHARQVVVESPLLTEETLADIEATDVHGQTVDCTFDPEDDLDGAIEAIQAAAATAVQAGAEYLLLSDRNAGPDRLPIPSLLATGAVHHHLVREGLRAQTSLIIDSADPRTTHQVATLIGYGADAIVPYLALETVCDLVAGPDALDESQAIETYLDVLRKGLLKIMAKMGISTVESYQGAQIFEVVGLAESVVEAFFEGTPNRTNGITLDGIEADLRERHARGFDGEDSALERHGEFTNVTTGRHHAWNPESVQQLQSAVRTNDRTAYDEFAAGVQAENERVVALRNLLAFRDETRQSIPLEEVEPVEDILTRFSTAAMSLGSLSPEAHENNAIATNRIGATANTGEGGEPSDRFGTETECSIKQVASGRFGVTTEYVAAADQLQIKMAQGSKPGEGGHLPGEKVNEMIADVRSATPGVPLISPPPQHDIYSIEDLKQLITDLKTANEDAAVHVKLVSEAGIGTIAAGVAKAKADKIHISGHSGGTGASPKTSIKHAGVPWELGLAEANDLLRETGLRSRVTLRVDGGLKTGRDVAIAALLGAEEFAFGTASLVSSGCVMARICQTNNCPTGVATQKPTLRERFSGQPDHVINYFTFIAQELREIMADLGVRTVDDLVGRVEFLRQRSVDAYPADQVDVDQLLRTTNDRDGRVKTRPQVMDVDGDEHIDRHLIEEARPAIENTRRVSIEGEITNEDRTVGAKLSTEIVRETGGDGLKDGAIRVDLKGTAGQSFGAFLTEGVFLSLSGPANDYVGKGMSGGTIAVSTPPTAGYDPGENILVGNVGLYGATDGELYVNGVAGERFGVRNSGAAAVVEGVGDHGCEYMTGGIVAVLGTTGKNFGAGMSGGIAYVFDPDGTFPDSVNTELVSVEADLEESDRRALKRLLENHAEYTDSDRAKTILDNWREAVGDFWRVLPDPYMEALEANPEADVRKDLPSPPHRWIEAAAD